MSGVGLPGGAAGFAAEDFDPKAWVNAAAKAAAEAAPGAGREAALGDLELRAQLLADELASGLEDAAAAALARLPRARSEVRRIQEEAAGLSERVGEILGLLAGSEASASQAVAVLEVVDRVKGQVQAARDTLQEAAGLAELMNTVEGTFATGDLGKISATLAAMRRGLDTVGGVPEFAGGESRLRRLEGRLEGMVAAPLTEALAGNKEEEVRELALVLNQVGKHATLASLYAAAKLPRLRDAWHAYGGAEPFARWLPTYLDQVHAAVESESRWCAAVLPAEHPALILGLLRALFDELGPSFAARVKDAAAAADAAPIEVLVEVKAGLKAAVDALQMVFGWDCLVDHVEVLHGLYAPLAPHLANYGQLELRHALAQLDSLELPGRGAGASQDAKARSIALMAASVGGATRIMEGALARCGLFTRGLELPALLAAVDSALDTYVSGRLKAGLGVLYQQFDVAPGAAPGAAAAAAAAAAEPRQLTVDEDIGVALKLIAVSKDVLKGVDFVNAACGAARESLQKKWDRPQGEVLILKSLLPDRARVLAVVLARATESGASLLPAATAAAMDFIRDAETFVLDVILSPVRKSLRSLAGLGVWGEAARASETDLPAFSALPNQETTDIGEYLLMLPEQLDVLGPPPEEAAELAGQDEAGVWVVKVASAIAAEYGRAVVGIRSLTGAGANQMAADLDYFCNVLAAVLGEEVPARLRTFQMGAPLPPERLTELARERPKGVDPEALAALLRMKKAALKKDQAA